MCLVCVVYGDVIEIRSNTYLVKFFGAVHFGVFSPCMYLINEIVMYFIVLGVMDVIFLKL